ncbi:AsnC family transcriptional regulator [Brevibacterium sanguinis]|uniref:AsnC family transcriptional regulator n=2 Tax=Brevibacterium TaxID=1696 RepID=A0A366II75_9MICO|nr:MULTISPECIES: Lrp/AsnC family transcriptional regulator [Brevibacterium]RBP62023.1 AsnC family transcriptional regulator [Brevibacterium sanguinis]RBP70555.1 AsnC family transcriptional regulator [Brevibacterium celere]
MRQTEQSRLDAALIRALQRDGRASVLDLARAHGVSRHVIAERLQVLTERDGLRVVAALDPGFAGHHVLTHSMVSIDGPVRPVAEAVARLPDAVFVSLASGERPLVVESRHATVAGLHATLDSVRAIRGVRGIRVTTYAEVLRGFFVAARREDIVLDDLDRELIGILQTDGRISYRALAEAVHRSPSAVRSRVRRLIDAGVMRIAAIKSGVLSPSRFATGIGITVSGDPDPVRRFILDSPAVEFAARSHGAHDFVATVVGASSVEVLDIIEQLRALEDVAALETWTHFDVIKEDYARLAGVSTGG